MASAQKYLVVRIPAGAANLDVDSKTTPFRFMRIVGVSNPAANVQIKQATESDGGDYIPVSALTRTKRALSEKPITKLYVKSDTASMDVFFVVSEFDEAIQDAPDIIQLGTVNNIPIGPSLMQDDRFGPGTNVPLQSLDGFQLLSNSASVTSAQTSDPALGNLNTAVAGMLMLQLAAGATAGDVMSVKKGSSFLPVYDEEGRYYSAGLIPFDADNPVGKIFYIDTRAISVVTFAAVVGSVKFIYTLAPTWALPVPPKQKDYTNVELGSTALGAGITSFYWTTVGIYRRTTGSVAKAAKRMLFQLSYTPAAGTALVLYGLVYAKGGATATPFDINVGTVLGGAGVVAGTAYNLNILLTDDGRLIISAANVASFAYAVATVIIPGLLPVDDLDLHLEAVAGSIDTTAAEARVSY